MFVKKFKLNRNRIDDQTAVDIPLEMDHQQVDNTDVIERDFIEGETEKAINPIVDHDQFRFKPYFYDNEEESLKEIKVVNYNLHFLIFNSVYPNGKHYPSSTTYNQLGFSKDDLRFRKNRFTNSFLRLNFFNNDNTMDQSLIAASDLFCSLRVPTEDSDLQNSDIKASNNLPKDLIQIPVKFELTNPSLTKARIHEGVHLFWYENDLPKEMFMQATFNNAANGETTDFMTESGSFAVNNFVDKIHTKFILKKKNNTYYYVLDQNYSNNISIGQLNSGHYKMDIDLYEVSVK